MTKKSVKHIIAATAIINSKALINNYCQIKLLVPNAKVLAVLKANGYGHGLTRIAKLLVNSDTPADAFGVARLDEALLLRAAGIVQPIVLLEGVFNQADLPLVAVNDLQVVVHDSEQLDAIVTISAEKLLQKQLKVWLKIDTGMHRLGINKADFEHFYQRLKQSKNVQNSMVLMSHLACADEKNNSNTVTQLAVFEQITAAYSEPKSCANSAGICAWASSYYNWLRPGLMLYGVSPLSHAAEQTNENAASLNISPVMTLQASIIAIRQVTIGESVGYGANWTSDRNTTIGVIAIGYGDGYPRHAENGTPVLLNGRIVPLVGRVSMDMITVDLGAQELGEEHPNNKIHDEIGDIATLWGKGLPVEIIAKHATTIAYELLCNIKSRVKIVEI